MSDTEDQNFREQQKLQEILQKLQEENRERSRNWDDDRVNPQQQKPEDPARTRDWNQDKKPEKKS